MSDETLVALTEEEEAALLDMLVRYARGFDVQPYEQAVAVRLIRAAERDRVLAEAERQVRALSAAGTTDEHATDFWISRCADAIAALRGQTEERHSE